MSGSDILILRVSCEKDAGIFFQLEENPTSTTFSLSWLTPPTGKVELIPSDVKVIFHPLTDDSLDMNDSDIQEDSFGNEETLREDPLFHVIPKSAPSNRFPP